MTRPVRLLSLTVAIGVAGCASYGGQRPLDMGIAASAPRGFVLESVVAFAEPEGVRFHGTLCRRSVWPAPTRIRADRTDAAGAVFSTASITVSGLAGRDRHCIFFNVPTTGALRPGEHAWVCAKSGSGPCETRDDPPSANEATP